MRTLRFIAGFILLASPVVAQVGNSGGISSGLRFTNTINAFRAANPGQPDGIFIGHSVPAGYSDITNWPPTNSSSPPNYGNVGGYSPEIYNAGTYGIDQDSGNTNSNMGYIISYQLGGYLRITNCCWEGSTMEDIYTREVQPMIAAGCRPMFCFLQGGVINDINHTSGGVPDILPPTSIYWLNEIAAAWQAVHVPFYFSEETPSGASDLYLTQSISNWNNYVVRDYNYTNIYNAHLVRGVFNLLANQYGEVQQTPVQYGQDNGSPHLFPAGEAVAAQFWLTVASNLIAGETVATIAGNFTLSGHFNLTTTNYP